MSITANTVLRGSVIQERTRSAKDKLEMQSRKSYKDQDSRQRQRPLTDKNGVSVWANAWMRHRRDNCRDRGRLVPPTMYWFPTSWS